MRRTLLLAVAMLASVVYAGQARAESPAATPRALCGPGSNPETGRQGRVSADDVASGRAAKGFWCNMQVVGTFGQPHMAGAGGYRVHRYVDKAGHECAYYDSTLLFPANLQSLDRLGVFVLDMTEPSKPQRTTSLMTPAMLSPHESLSFNAKRGLLAAGMGNPTTYPGVVDVYDVRSDCRAPVLKASLPVGFLGHEGNFSPDGNTYWTGYPGGSIAAVDVSTPSAPVVAWASVDYESHGLSVSEDGNRVYYADRDKSGLSILDVSQVQKRVPDPAVKMIGHVTWPTVSIPQVPIPVTIKGHPYIVEIDEYTSSSTVGAYDPKANVGAARIIDIADETKPVVISDIKLEVNLTENRESQTGDPGATSGLAGYAGHYCGVPSRVDPGIVACSFILSGLRVFDIRDPFHPKEIAYFNPGGSQTSYAMSGPAFVPERHEIWYSDGNKGFFALRVTNGVWP